MEHDFLNSRITGFARQCPHKIAVKSENQSLSYLELEKRSNRIANFLNNKIEKIRHVVIILDRSPELIESIIGVLKSGLIFVPVSPAFPQNRVKKMIEETRADWVITDVNHYEKFKDILENTGKKTYRAHLKTLIINGDGENCRWHKKGNTFYLNSNIESHRLTFDPVFNKNCYIYFTSGSTGVPKGVLGRRGSLAHFIQWEINTFAVNEDFFVSQLTPPSFDPFLRDIFLPLTVGGTSCIPSNRTLMNMRELIRWIDKNDITLIHTVPTLFKHLISEIEDSNCFFRLKYILLAGELLRGRDVHRFTRLFNHRIQLVNVYGPTETTLAKLFYPIKPEDTNRGIIPVGKPINGAQVLILDSKKQKCWQGQRGEIYIRTPFISSGYVNDPGLNEKLFIKNPYGKHAKDIIYKTGDMGRLLPDGNIELSGRVDSQVKIRGVRIELGEIENQLLNHKDVLDAVVIPKEENNGDKYLCAYVVPVPGKEPVKSVLREYLSKYLPGNMIPSIFKFTDHIPLTDNGKVDRNALPEPGAEVMGIAYTAPRDELEKKLVEIWSGVLGIEKDKIGIDANFFEVGGHSLTAMILISKINEQLKVKLLFTDLFKLPTIKGLAERIQTKPEVVEEIDFKKINKRLKKTFGRETKLVKFFVEEKEYIVLYAKKNVQKISEYLENNYSKEAAPHYVKAFENVPGEYFKRVDEEKFTKLLGLKNLGSLDKNELNELQHSYTKKLEKITQNLHSTIMSREIVDRYYCGGSVRWYMDINLNSQFSFIINFFNEPDIRRLEQAVVTLLNVQPLLRSCLAEENEEYKFVEFGKLLRLRLPLFDFSHYYFEKISTNNITKFFVARLRKMMAAQNPVKNILFTFVLLKLNLKDYILIFMVDHIISDNHGNRILQNYFEQKSYHNDNFKLQKNSDYKNFISEYMIPSAVPGTREHFKMSDDYTRYRDAVARLQKIYPKGKQIIFSDRYTLEYYIENNNSQKITPLGYALYICANVCSILFDSRKIPIKVLSNIRNFGGSKYYYTIGDMHDEVPILFDVETDNSPGKCYQTWNLTYEKYINKKRHFISMGYPDPEMSRYVLHSPIDLNYLGEITPGEEIERLNTIKPIPHVSYPVPVYSVSVNKLGMVFSHGMRTEKIKKIEAFLDKLKGKYEFRCRK